MIIFIIGLMCVHSCTQKYYVLFFWMKTILYNKIWKEIKINVSLGQTCQMASEVHLCDIGRDLRSFRVILLELCCPTLDRETGRVKYELREFLWDGSKIPLANGLSKKQTLICTPKVPCKSELPFLHLAAISALIKPWRTLYSMGRKLKNGKSYCRTWQRSPKLGT